MFMFLLIIISGKNEPGRTSGPSANGVTSNRFFLLAMCDNYEFILVSEQLIILYLQPAVKVVVIVRVKEVMPILKM